MTYAADLVDGMIGRQFQTFPSGAAPSRKLAVVTCMDSRIDVFAMLGLSVGEAHVIRNAGAMVTEDLLRSLVISQHRLGTRGILLIGHTDCGLCGLDEDAFNADLTRLAGGAPPPWTIGSFGDVDAFVSAGAEIIRQCPYLVARDAVYGLVFDLAAGRVRGASAHASPAER